MGLKRKKRWGGGGGDFCQRGWMLVCLWTGLGRTGTGGGADRAQRRCYRWPGMFLARNSWLSKGSADSRNRKSATNNTATHGSCWLTPRAPPLALARRRRTADAGRVCVWPDPRRWVSRFTHPADRRYLQSHHAPLDSGRLSQELRASWWGCSRLQRGRGSWGVSAGLDSETSHRQHQRTHFVQIQFDFLTRRFFPLGSQLFPADSCAAAARFLSAAPNLIQSKWNRSFISFFTVNKN